MSLLSNSCGDWMLKHIACGCRDAGRQHNEQEGAEAAASHDIGQAKAEPIDDTPAHGSGQVCVRGPFCCLLVPLRQTALLAGCITPCSSSLLRPTGLVYTH